ncbi:MAG: hypothetical protein QM783_19410 [Phycisphaerales bacterium]
MSAIPPWLWLTTGWTLIASGTLLLLRGRLFRKRLKTPHCPKCGYSAQGLTTRKCPECGFAAHSDRQLLTAPARWRWRTLGIVVALIGWLLLRVPLVIQRGWPGGVPDWALAFLAPKTDGQMYNQGSNTLALFATSPATTPAPRNASEALQDEAIARLKDGTFSHPFADWYLRRCAELTRENVTDRLELPIAWPWDVAVDGVVYKPSPGYLPRLSYTTDRFAGPSTTMRIHVTGEFERRTYDLGDFTVPVDATRPLATFFTLQNDQASNDAVKAAFHPVICAGVKHDVWIESSPPPTAAPAIPGVPPTPPPAPDPNLPAFAGLRVSVLLANPFGGDDTLGTTNIPLGPQSGWRTRPTGATYFANVWWKDNTRPRTIDHFEDLELHIQGDTDIAWETYRQQPRTSPVAWTGSLRIKPGTVRRGK